MPAVKVKMSPKGQVVVPRALRKQLGIEYGMEMVASIENGSIVLKPIHLHRKDLFFDLQRLDKLSIDTETDAVHEVRKQRR